MAHIFTYRGKKIIQIFPSLISSAEINFRDIVDIYGRHLFI